MTTQEKHLERKYRDIGKDFKKLSDKGFFIQVIYQKLSNKYYLDEGSIFRIIYGQTRFQKRSKAPPDLNTT